MLQRFPEFRDRARLLRLVLLGGLVALAACASGRETPDVAAPPPDLTGSPPKAGAATEPAAGAVARPGGPASNSRWLKTGVTPERQRADTEACYRYAWAQVDKDIRIDDDISAARDDAFSSRSQVQGLTRSADSFYYQRQRGVRFEECMRSKGYSLI